MMHKIRGNVLHWLIMPVMLLGVIIGMELPVNAANTDGTVLTEALVREVGGSYYYNLQPGTWYIDDDVDLEYGILVEYGTVTINLNGHTLNYAGFYDNSVIYVTGGNLTVNNGTITGGRGNNEIHNKGNINAEKRGGGFAVAGNDTVVTINHVTIRDNQANWGGGLFLDNCSCCVTLNHSTVTNNIVQEDWGNGGGVFFDGGTLVLNNSQITENRSESGTWAGVSVGEGCKSLQLSGNSRIYDNIDDERQENLHIGGEVGAYGSFQGVSVTGVLGEDALFGVTMTSPGLFTTSENTTFNDPGRFVSDASDNAVAYKVKYISNESASLTEDQQKKNGQLILASDSKVSVSGYTGCYDEMEHGIDVSYNGAETITYGTTEGKCDKENSPTYIKRGLYTVYYQVQTEAEDGVYALISGCATVNIQAKATFKAVSDDESGEEKGVTVGRPYTLPECEDFYFDPPNDSPEGTVFAGWKSEADDKVYAAGDSVILNDDTTFTAQWETGVKADFVDEYENNWDSSESITVIKGTVIKLPKLSSFDSDAPKCFVKWSDGTNTYDQGAKYTLTKNTIFTTVSVEGVKPTYYYNSEESKSGTKVIPGTKIRLPQLDEDPLWWSDEPEGKFFAGWNDGQKTYQAGTMYPLTEDTSFHAVWMDGYVINDSEDNTANLNGKEVGDSVLVRDDDIDGELRIIIPEGKTIRITGTVSTEEGSFFISCGEDEPSDTLASFSGGKQTVDVTTDKSPVYLVLSGAQDPDVELTVTITSALHTHSFSYAVGTGANANTITATCSVTGCPNDYGENGLKLTLSATGGTYDGNAKAATVSGYPEVPPDNLAAEPTTITYYKSTGVDSTTTSGNALSGAPTDAGSYVAQLTWGGQTASKAFTIAKCSVILTTPTAKTLTYNGQPQELITVGIVEGGSIEYAVTTENKEPAADEYIFNNTSIPTGTDAGTYYVWYRVKGDSNHNDTEPLCIPVTIENASMSVSSEGYTGIYDKQAHGITVTAPEGATVNYRTTDSGAYDLTDNPTYTDAGTYTVYYQVTKANHTAVSGSETITINKKDVTVSGITADSKTYDRSRSATINTSGASFAGLLSGDTLTVSATGTFDDMNVGAGKTVTIGNLAIGGTSAGNYKLAENGQQAATTADITAKALTVTAEAKTKVYDTDDPELTYTQDGLISGDSFTGALTRAEGSDVGTYEITQGTLTAGDNYTISYEGAHFTITKSTPVVTRISARALVYDKTGQALVTQGTTSGGTLQYAMTAKNEAAPADDAYSENVPVAANAGNYTVYYRVVGGNNYTDADPVSVDVTIARKPIRINGITAQNKTYDSTTDATLVYSGINWEDCGMCEGDNLTISAKGTFTDAGAADGKIVNITGLTLDGDTISEYVLAEDGQQIRTSATIFQREVGLKWCVGDTEYDGVEQIPSFIFNGKNQKPDATATGLVEGDTCSVTVTGGQTNVGNYTATASSLSNDNYKLPDEVTIPYNITPRTIKTYDIVFGHSDGLESGHYEYTGSVITPEITVSTVLAGDTNATNLNLNTDYIMSLNTTAVSTGDHYIKFEGKNNYNGVVYKTWSIDPTTITVTADNKSKTYGDSDPEFTVTVTGPEDAVSEIEYTVSRENVGEDEGENVGKHEIVVIGDGTQGDYKVNFVNGTLTINQAPVTVTAGNKSKNYGDEDPAFTSTVTGLKRNDNESVITRTLSRAAGENAGSYTITPDGASAQGNYSVTYNTGTLTIKKRRLTTDFVHLNPVSFKYDGINKKPNVVFDKYEPVQAKDYTISGETAANDKGRHSITVNGVGDNFSGSVTLYWYITGVGDNEVTYDGLPHTIKVDEEASGVTTYKGEGETIYSESAPVYTEAGTYTIYYKTTIENPMYEYIPNEKETLDIEGSAVLTIKKAPLTVAAENKTKVYGDADPALTYNVTGIIEDETVSDALTGGLTRAIGENVGAYDITQGTLAGTSNYEITTFTPATLTITLKPLNAACFDVKLATDVLDKNTVVYNAEPWAVTATKATGIEGLGTITPRYFKVVGETETEIMPVGNAPTEAGKYRVRLEVSVGTNYTGTGSEVASFITTDDWWFEIVKAPFPEDTVTANWPTVNEGLAYSGEDQILLTAPTTYLSGYTMNYRIGDGEWGTALPKGRAAGEYTLYAKYVSTDQANRLDSEERSYTVSIARRPITVTADDKSKTYGTDDPAFTYTVTAGSLVEGESLNGILVREEGENVRADGYAIDAGTLTNEMNPNYNITFVPGTFTITRASITPAVSMAGWIYGDDASEPIVSGNTGNGEVTYTYADKNSDVYTEAVPTDAGEYTIKARIAANGNCDAGEATSDFAITAKQVEVKALDIEKEYGSTDPVLTYTVTSKSGSDVDQVLFNDILSGISISRTAGEDVNDKGYAIIVSQSVGADPNYEVTFVPGTFTITRKAVTVTADDAGKVYGAAEPAAFTATVDGLIGADTVTYTAARAEGENVGEYTITPTGDTTQGNYTVSYATGTFKITKAALTVAAEAKSKTYGEADPSLTYSVSGLVNGDTAEVVTGELSRAAGDNVGTYAITKGTLSAGNNYTISYTGADLTIGKKTLTVTAGAKTKTYGNTDPTLTYTAEGFEYEDTVSTVMSGILARTEGEDVREGGYAILQGTLTAGDNYEINYTGADLTITKRSVTLTSSTDTKTYDGTALTNDDVTVGGDGFAEGEGAEYDVTGTQTLPGESDNTFTYSLKDGTKADNYEITKSEGTLTVTGRTDDEGTDKKYEINLEAKSDEITYDGAEHSVDGFVTDKFIFNGVTYTVSGLNASASGTDADEYTSEVTGTAVVKDSDGNDLTDQFIVNTTDGKLTIDKRNVTITSATDSKTYDGKALTNDEVTESGDGFVTGDGAIAAEGADYEVTGSQKVVGSSANSFTYTLKEGTKADNYNITKVEGTLAVTSRDAKYEISPQANSGEAKYDGKEHQVSGFVADEFTVDGNTYTVSGLTASGKGTDAGTYTVSVTGTAVVTDSDGADVSDEFSVTPKAGTLTINKRSVTLTSATDSKEYDGDALTNDTVTVSGDGFAGGEGAEYSVTGTRTIAGTSENSFSYTLNENTKADNYDITTSNGTLTVNNRNTKYELTLKADSVTEKYDGTEKAVTGYTIAGKEGNTFTASNGKTYTISGMTVEASGTDAGEYTVNVTGTPTIKDSDDKDVTSQFAVSVESGTLTINKRSVTLTSDTASKAYDGKALKAEKAAVSGDGFAEGESADYEFTGSQTLPGESDNTFTYTLVNAKADNYDIATVYGKLAVNERNGEGDDGKYKITVKANSGTFTYDGKEHTVTGFETLKYTFNDVTYTVSGISASGSLTDAGEISVEITGTPKVTDADGNDLTDNFDVVCEAGLLTVSKRSQEKPEGLSSRKAGGDDTKDGVITGLDPEEKYEYSTDGGKTWTPVPEGETTIENLPAGEVVIRKPGDEDTNPSEAVKVTVGTKEDQTAPDADELTVANATGEDETDGIISGLDPEGKYEYSTDSGKTWTPVPEGETTIDNLPSGEILVRKQGDDDHNPSESVTVTVGVTSRTQGVVRFKPDKESETDTSVNTVVEDATSSNIEEFAATQMEEGKDVKVELEIIPQKEEDVSGDSVTKINDTVKEVFAGIETESIVTEYLEIDLAKYVDNAKEGNISDTKTPLEIELKYDKSKTGNPVIIRTHNGIAKVFEKLMARPASGFRDGTYHVEDGKIYLYSQYFSDYAIVYATEKTYYVNIDMGNGESIQKIVGEDDRIELLKDLTREGYSYGGLYKDASYNNAWNNESDKVKEDTTLYAKWNKSVTGVTVDVSNVSLTKAGETSQIKVNVLPSDAADRKVTFTSSNPKVATVDKNGKITAIANGTATITVTTEDGKKTVTVNVTVAIPDIMEQGTGDTVTPAQLEKNSLAMNEGLKIDQKGSKINISWGKVADADGYEVYVAYCGTNFNTKKPAKTIKNNETLSTTITKIKGKKINLKKNYKLYIIAYKLVDGEKSVRAKSITGHIVGRKNTAYTNVKSIKLTKSKYTISAGKTAKIKAKTVLVDKNKKQLSDAHAAQFRYASSNKNIATVDKNGKVKGVAKGTCTIYVYARNGYAKKVKVTVK